MAYTLAEVDFKIKTFTDKLGSDYFPMNVILQHFTTAALKFIGEKLRHVEKNQEVVDDIRPLFASKKLPIAPDVNDTTRYVAAVPVNYMRTAAYDILYDNGDKCRRADMIKQAEYKTNSNDPNKRPDKWYPIILQENNLFQIDCGPTAIPSFFILKYYKKPSFARTSNKDVRIVNLPDEAIENIILSTVTSLFKTTGDPRFQSNHFIEDAYRKFSR